MPTATPIPPTPTIVLSEIMSNPSEGNEWIELYNASDFTAELTNWHIDTTTFSITIPPKSYRRVLIAKNILNNNGDHVTISSSVKQQIDFLEFPALSQDETYSKQFDNGNWCITSPSPDEKNNICTQPTPTQIIATALPSMASPTRVTPTVIFPTIKIATSSGTVLGNSIQKPLFRDNSPISISPLPSFLVLFFSLCALLCYTDSTDYGYIEKMVTSLIRPTRKKRL
jgi:hypothetical protein